MQDLLDYAATSQDEVCALILNDERVFRCRNVHPEPWHHFRIGDDDWLAAEEEGEIGGWAVPTISGYDKNNYVVFGRCNSGNTIDFDGTTVRFYQPPSGRGHRPTTGTIDIVIFASGVTPTPGNGLTILNAAGQCTFSTVKRPFVFLGGMWKPSTSGVSIGNGYVPLGRYGFNVNTDGGVYTFWMYGIKIQNGQASVQGGVYIGFDQYAIFGNNQVTDLSLPVLPDMYL